MHIHSATSVDRSFASTFSVRRRSWLLLVIGAVLLVSAATPVAAEPIPITVPTSLSPGDPYRLAFVTSTTHNALSPDIGVYNAFVDLLGDTAIASDWSVIGSTSAVDARTNTSTDPTPTGPTGVPIFLLNDTKLVDNYDDLWDASLDTALNISETGLDPGGTLAVWSGSENSGLERVGGQLGAGTIGVATIRAGFRNFTDGRWIGIGVAEPEKLFHLYAISGLLEVPTVTVIPEPGSLILMCIGAVGLLGYGARRKRKTAIELNRSKHPNH